MNRIQNISRALQAERLKLQMGLDPRMDIDPSQVRRMWNELHHQQLKSRLGRRFSASGAAANEDH